MKKFFKNFYLLSEEELEAILNDPADTYQYTCIIGVDKEDVANTAQHIDKHRPKLVRIEQLEPWVGTEVSCPNCGDNSLIDVTKVSSANYCPNCGQALSFSNVPVEFFDEL